MATVLLTGASGFLGVHTVQHLLDAGHDVRALVRTPRRLRDHLRPLGVDDARLDVIEGDMTSVPAVREAVAGCDAVIHAAATYSFRRSDARTMEHDNVTGTRAVLEAAAEAGCRNAVHVSSTVALVRPGGAPVDERSPLGPGMGPYSRSKVASERVARGMQDAGAPVTVVNPGGILGPHDPYLGESNDTVVQILKGRIPAWPKGRLQYVDVRDCAAALVAAAGQEPGRRFIVPGETVTSLHPLLRTLTGRRLPVATLPAGRVAPAALPGYLTGWSMLPGTVEGVRIVGCGNQVDDSASSVALGLTARPLRESLADTVRWLVSAGHVSRKEAGKLA